MNNIPSQTRRLHTAVNSGDLSKVKAIVEAKTIDLTEITLALPVAVVGGHTDIAGYLIKEGADMHYFDKGTPLLVTTILRRNTDMFHMLLSHCHNINVEYSKGNLAHAAVKVRSLDVLKELENFRKPFLLLDKADDVSRRTPLHEAVVVLSRGIEQASPPSPGVESIPSCYSLTKGSSTESGEENMTTEQPKVKAICLRSLSNEMELASFPLGTEIVRFLLERKCNPNTIDRQGRTPLHDAAAGGKLDIVLMLVSAGALLYQEDNRGSLPWTEAMSGGHEGIASHLLKEQDLYCTFRDHRLNSNHAFAAIGKSIACVQYLIKRGLDMADGRLINREGVTPLIRAIRKNRADVASLLVRFSGPVLNERTLTDFTAVEYALDAWQSREDSCTGWKKVLDDMVKHGAKLNQYIGVSRIHILMQRNYLISPWRVDWILSQSPDLNVKSKEGWHLFRVAVHHLSMVRPNHIGVKVLLKLLNHGMRVPRQFVSVKPRTNTSDRTFVKSSSLYEALQRRHVVLAYMLHLVGCHSGKNEINCHLLNAAYSQCTNEYAQASELIEYLIKVEKQPSRLHDLARTVIIISFPPGDIRAYADRLPLPIELKRRLEWEHDVDSKPKALPHFYKVIKEMLEWPEDQDDSPEWEEFLFPPEINFL